LATSSRADQSLRLVDAGPPPHRMVCDLPLALADEVLYSLSNVVLTFGLAHQLGLGDFGRFALCYSIGAAMLLIVRAYCVEALVSIDHASWRQIVASRFALLGTLCSAVAIAMSVSLFHHTAGGSYLLLVPLVVLQDLARHDHFRGGELGILVFSDALWVGAALLPLAVPDWPLGGVLESWALGLSGSCVVLGIHSFSRFGPSWGSPRKPADLTGFSATVEQTISVGLSLGFISVVALIAPVGLSVLRMVDTIFGPAQTLLGSARGHMSKVVLQMARTRFGLRLGPWLYLAIATLLCVGCATAFLFALLAGILDSLFGQVGAVMAIYLLPSLVYKYGQIALGATTAITRMAGRDRHMLASRILATALAVLILLATGKLGLSLICSGVSSSIGAILITRISRGRYHAALHS
jgi:hypothetical protein